MAGERGYYLRCCTHPLLLSMLAPDSEDAHQEGQGGHDHLPGLGGAKLSVAPEHFPVNIYYHYMKQEKVF